MIKKYLVLLFSLACLSCSEETPEEEKINSLEVSSLSVKASNRAELSTVTIPSNGDWYADVEDGIEWMTVTRT